MDIPQQETEMDINLLYFFFFFLILPTSDKRGILAVTVITLFCVQLGSLRTSSEQASLNCTVSTTASHHMMNTVVYVWPVNSRWYIRRISPQAEEQWSYTTDSLPYITEGV